VGRKSLGPGDGNPPAGSRGRASVRVWEQGPHKPDMHIQSAVDKRIFVMCSYKIYGVPLGSCGVCYPHPTPPKKL